MERFRKRLKVSAVLNEYELELDTGFCFVLFVCLFVFERCLNLEPKYIKEEIPLLTGT